MPLLLQICCAIVTMALVVLAIVTVRTLNRFARAADAFNETAPMMRNALVQVDQVVREARELLNAVEQTLTPVRRTLERLESVGDRAADISGALLAEIEGPLQTAVAVSRGVRQGTMFLFSRLARRFDRQAGHNGGQDHA
jgi:uncharacterized protein YoxC